MTRRTSPGMEQSLSVLRRHRIRRLQGKIVLPLGQQKVRERCCDLPLFLGAELGQHVRHRRTGLGPMRIANVRLKVIRVHPGTDRGEKRRFLRSSGQRRFARVTCGTVQFFDQDQTLEVRVELAGGQCGDGNLRKRDRSNAEQQHGSKEDALENSFDT